MGEWRDVIQKNGIPPGAVASLEGDFSPNGVALFLALMEHRCVLVPLSRSIEAKKQEFIQIAQVEVSFHLDGQDSAVIVHRDCLASHPYYQTLRQVRRHPGLVLFSS